MLKRPLHLPAARKRLARFHAAMGDLYPTLGPESGIENLEGLAVANRLLATAASAADLYWVTRDMAQVALDAATDLPDLTITEDMAPAEFGLLVYEPGSIEGPWPEADLIGFMWALRGSNLYLWHLTETPDDVRAGMAQATGVDKAAAPEVTLGTSAISLPVGEPTDFGALTGDGRAFGPLLAATWVLMMTPTVADRRVVSERTSRSRAKRKPPVLVTTVGLRPMRHVTDPDDESGDRQWSYRHRFVVRGHWRQQAHGPDRSLRRTLWVASYVKGPEGAPLLAREHVNVWRR